MKLALLTALAATLIGAPAAAAQTPSFEYTLCEPVGQASIVEVTIATCDEARAAAAAVLAAPPASAGDVLRAGGWTPLRALVAPGEDSHDLVATRTRGALRIRRPGPPPDIDSWEGGRELLFSRRVLVPGERPPQDAVVCTSAFLVRLSSGRLGGLTASHCGGTRRDGTVHRRNVVLRRPPQAGVLLGRVLRNVARTRPLDALLLPVPTGTGHSAAPLVDRGITHPPLSVAGSARPFSGRRVCFSGRTSGIDRCGEIAGPRARPAERLLRLLSGGVVRCTTIRARQGDSGSAVYTAPRADGSVRAVGIAVIVVGSRSRMCFTPLIPVLDALNARLVAAG